jgi:hypothetical protein
LASEIDGVHIAQERRIDDNVEAADTASPLDS